MSPRKEISANLDLLRAVAVLSVFVSHFFRAHGDLSWSSLGRFGVILFFVHTSFVLMASLERLEKTARSKLSLALAFWIRRIFRIYPLAILCVVSMALFRIPINPEQTYYWIGLKGFLANLALIQNLTYSPDIQGPLWSLPVEVQIYLILPFAYFAVRGNKHYRSLALWILAAAAALAAVYFAHIPAGPWVPQRLNIFLYAPCFTSGIVAFDLIRSRRSSWKLPAWVWLAGISAAIVLFGPHDNLSLPAKLFRAWGLSLMLGVLYANVRESRPNWTQNIFHWIAEHSYGIYLSHSAVFWVVYYRMAQTPFWAQSAVLAAAAAGIPALLYVAIEKPLIRAGSRLAGRLLA
ncbi:MAG: acyltransferase [Terracidiphilus sp.]